MNPNAPLTLDGLELGAPRRRQTATASPAPSPAPLARQVQATPPSAGLWALLVLLLAVFGFVGYVRARNRRDWEEE
jgi:hypothetical protein